MLFVYSIAQYGRRVYKKRTAEAAQETAGRAHTPAGIGRRQGKFRIMPKYRNKGNAQQAITELEKICASDPWCPDTILQEKDDGNTLKAYIANKQTAGFNPFA